MPLSSGRWPGVTAEKSRRITGHSFFKAFSSSCNTSETTLTTTYCYCRWLWGPEVEKLTWQTPWAYCEISKDIDRSQNLEEGLSGVPGVGIRGAIGSRPPSWRSRQLDDIPPLTTIHKAALSESSLGSSSLVLPGIPPALDHTAVDNWFVFSVVYPLKHSERWWCKLSI